MSKFEVALPRKPRWDPKKVREAGYYMYFKEISEHLPNGRVRLRDGSDNLMLGGYSYHGLGCDPRVITAAKSAVDRYGTTTHGSRFLAGTTGIHRELEAELADFIGVDDVVTFSSGYTANLAAIGSLCTKADVIMSDFRNHASLIDGMRLSRAHVLTENLSSWDGALPSSVAKPGAGGLIVSDGVFSMDGTCADLAHLVGLADQLGAALYVDECHSMFALGKTGRGLCELQGVEPDRIAIHMGTLSKAIPAQGGYVGGSRDLCEFLRHEARGFIYSGAPGPAAAGAALGGIKILREETWRFHELDRKAGLFRDRLKQNGLDVGDSVTAIVPVILGPEQQAFEVARRCHEIGIFVHSIIPPIVPPGTSRLRCSVMSCHEDQQLLAAADKIAEIVRAVRNDLESGGFTAFR